MLADVVRRATASGPRVIGYNTAPTYMTHAVQIPSTVLPGDLLVAYWAMRSDAAQGATAPAGWTSTANVLGAYTGLSSSTLRAFCYRKIAVAGDAGSTVTFTTSIGTSALSIVIALRGSTYAGVGIPSSPARSNTVQAPAPNAGKKVLRFYSVASPSSLADPVLTPAAAKLVIPATLGDTNILPAVNVAALDDAPASNGTAYFAAASTTATNVGISISIDAA